MLSKSPFLLRNVPTISFLFLMLISVHWCSMPFQCGNLNEEEGERQLGYHNKPIVLLNIADYYRPMLEMIEHGIEQKFIMPRAWDLFCVATTVEQAIAHLRQPVAPEQATRTISG